MADITVHLKQRTENESCLPKMRYRLVFTVICSECMVKL